MKTLLLPILLCLAIPARADHLDDPYGGFGSSQRKFDEIMANSPIGPPPVDGDEAALRSYFYELEDREDARWRLQRDAEIRLHELEERQEEMERERKDHEWLESFERGRD
jgi:hypothetical protein